MEGEITEGEITEGGKGERREGGRERGRGRKEGRTKGGRRERGAGRVIYNRATREQAFTVEKLHSENVHLNSRPEPKDFIV